MAQNLIFDVSKIAIKRPVISLGVEIDELQPTKITGGTVYRPYSSSFTYLGEASPPAVTTFVTAAYQNVGVASGSISGFSEGFIETTYNMLNPSQLLYFTANLSRTLTSRSTMLFAVSYVRFFYDDNTFADVTYGSTGVFNSNGGSEAKFQSPFPTKFVTKVLFHTQIRNNTTTSQFYVATTITRFCRISGFTTPVPGTIKQKSGLIFAISDKFLSPLINPVLKVSYTATALDSSCSIVINFGSEQEEYGNKLILTNNPSTVNGVMDFGNLQDKKNKNFNMAVIIISSASPTYIPTISLTGFTIDHDGVDFDNFKSNTEVASGYKTNAEVANDYLLKTIVSNDYMSKTHVASNYISLLTVTDSYVPKSIVGTDYRKVFFVNNATATKGSFEDRVKLTWLTTEGAVKYNIYKKNLTGDFVKIAEVNDGKNTYYDMTAVKGTHYFYKISAVNSNSAESELTSELEGYCNDIINSVKDVEATSGIYEDKVIVTWRNDPLADTYTIYRKKAAESGAQKVELGVVPKNTIMFEDTTVPTNEVYFYYVKATSTILGDSPECHPDTGYRGIAKAGYRLGRFVVGDNKNNLIYDLGFKS